MADDAGGAGEGETEGGTTAATTGTEESADLGFYNRKLHNYPLVRVSAAQNVLSYVITPLSISRCLSSHDSVFGHE